NAVKGVAFSADKKVAIGVHIECPIYRPIRNIDRRLPGDPTVGGALELHAPAVTVNAVVCLVLEAVSRAAGLIDSKPLLIAAAAASLAREQAPGLAAVYRVPQVVAKKRQVYVRLKTEIEEIADLIGVCHWVAAKDVVFQDTRERPVYAAIDGITPAGLPEVGGNVIELSPGDCHLVAVRGINGNGALVRGVTDDVLAVRIDVDLVADEWAVRRDHAR